MSYVERQKECTWTSPKGTVFKLKLAKEYDETIKHIGEVKQNPSRSYGKKNSKRTYRTVNASSDTFHDMGAAGADIPLEVVISGVNHDVEADKLCNALAERGRGKLQLVYGGIRYVQVLEFKRKTNLIKNCSQTIFTIQFHEVSGNVYPQAKQEAKNKSIITANQAMSDLSEEIAETAETLEKPDTLTSKLQDGIVKLSSSIGNIQDATYTGILSDLVTGTILVNPYVMSTQIGKLINTAFNSYASASSVIHSLKSILNTFSKDEAPSRDEYVANNFIANSAIINAAEVLPQKEYETKREAVEAAESFQEIYDEYREYNEVVEKNFNETLEDFIYSSVNINKVVQETIGAVIVQADNLKVEQIVILELPSNLINIAFDYYPEMFEENPEAAIDYLIKTNDFIDDDYLFLNKGKEVKIYV